MALGQMQSGVPGLPVGFRIHFHGKQRKTRQGAIAKVSGVASAPYIHLQNIRNFPPP
jgi:hypothetical protein